jgi:hypothetical protein
VNRDLWTYTEAEFLWGRFLPDTPFGQAAKAKAEPCTDRGTLETRFDQTDACAALLGELEGDRVRLDRLRHHLKRLPRFPEAAREAFDEVEIFQLKKFIFNHGRLLSLLPAAVRDLFGLRPIPGGLEQLLGQGRQGDETFHIADGYDPDLSLVRRELRSLDADARAQREALDRQLRERWGFSFDGRAFVLVDRQRLGDPAAASGLLEVEPWDAQQVCVRPRPSVRALQLADQKAALLARERELEEQVLSRLSVPLAEAIPACVAQAVAVASFDLALAAAQLARDLRLVRPDLSLEGIRIEEGRHLPTEALCERLGTPYTPLTAAFEPGPAVLFGSNMGGKTVVLKTVGALQLTAQMGLFVPAARFQTRVFHRFHYVGEGRSREEERGLSGFGFEIRQFNEAHRDFGAGTLALFDEFARTTSSGEAEALLSAILEELVRFPQTTALFSTHFRGVRRLPGVRYLRMGGLDRSRLDGLHLEDAGLPARIREIDRRMRFLLEPDAPADAGSDALAVARLLGLAPALAARAEAFHANKA